MKEVGELLFPQQLGNGIERGIEIAIHSAHVYLSNLPHDHLILKLDFKNAFNTVRRDKRLLAVAHSLLHIVHSVYCSTYHPCFVGQKLFNLQKEYSNANLNDLYFFLSQLKSDLHMFYLDDGTLGGACTSQPPLNH